MRNFFIGRGGIRALYGMIAGAIVLLLCLTLSCSPEDEGPLPQAAEPALSVFVNIPPQAYFVERIGGERVDVKVLVPPGQDPHVFAPTPRRITELGAADIYFHGIMPFGKELARRVADTGAGTRIVDITEGIALRRIEQHCDHHHHGHEEEEREHEGGGNHDHHHHHGEGKDPHVWLSPPEIKRQADNIAAALREEDPEHGELYEENLNAFLRDLDAVHRELRETLAPLRGRAFYVFHPAFGYFANTYGLRQTAVETGGKSPSPRHLRELINQAKEEGVRIIFVQPQFDSRSAGVIAAAIDGAVVPLDPLAEDVLENLMRIGEKIQEALGRGEQ